MRKSLHEAELTQLIFSRPGSRWLLPDSPSMSPRPSSVCGIMCLLGLRLLSPRDGASVSLLRCPSPSCFRHPAR